MGMVAEPLDGVDAARTVTALILRYGTPAEGLGRGAILVALQHLEAALVQGDRFEIRGSTLRSRGRDRR